MVAKAGGPPEPAWLRSSNPTPRAIVPRDWRWRTKAEGATSYRSLMAPELADFLDAILMFRIQPSNTFEPMMRRIEPALRSMFFDEEGRIVPIDDDGLDHVVAMLGAERLQGFLSPIAAFMADDPEVGRILFDKVSRGLMMAPVVAMSGDFGSRRFVGRRWMGSAAARMADYDEAVGRERAEAARRRRDRYRTWVDDQGDFAAECMARHVEAVATGNAAAVPDGMGYLIPPDDTYADVPPYHTGAVPTRSPGTTPPCVVSRGIPKAKFGEEAVTTVLVDGKPYFHVNEALECLEVPSTKRRIRKLKRDGTLVEGHGFVTVRHRDTQGKVQNTTFISMVALAMVIMRSDEAMRPASRANRFANAVLSRLSPERSIKADALVAEIGPGVAHFARSAIRAMKVREARERRLVAEGSTLLDRNAVLVQEMDLLREDAEVARRAVREARAERDAGSVALEKWQGECASLQERLATAEARANGEAKARQALQREVDTLRIKRAHEQSQKEQQ